MMRFECYVRGNEFGTNILQIQTSLYSLNRKIKNVSKVVSYDYLVVKVKHNKSLLITKTKTAWAKVLYALNTLFCIYQKHVIILVQIY